jgi:hypothetical protein
MPKKVYTSFRDLAGVKFHGTKTLHVKPCRRSYISHRDAVYDWRVGHDMRVTDPNSPFNGCTVSVLDTATLRQHGYTDLSITINEGLEPIALPLVKEVF